MEKAMYEARPYAFLLVAFSAFQMNSPYPAFSMFCAGVLIITSGMILYWRKTYRDDQEYKRQTRRRTAL